MTNHPSNFDVYELHSKSLRAWLIAYGVAGPIFIFNKPEVWESLAKAPAKNLILLTFVGSTLAQVIVVFANKWVMYFQYRGDEDPMFCETPCYKKAEKLSKQAWIDITADIFSIGALSIGTALTYFSIT
jgi:hypothetical protein